MEATWTQHEISDYATLTWSRYACMAAFVLLLWDHVLTFKHEVQYIWPSRAIVVKWMFLINRYLVCVILGFNLHTQSGISTAGLTDNVCKGWIMVVFGLGCVSVAISHWLVLLKLWKLWDGNRVLVVRSIVIYALLQFGSISFWALTAQEALPTTHFSQRTRMCALSMRPRFLTEFYAWVLAFEILAYVMVCYNSLSRPRESHKALMEVLHHDGVLYFIATITLRILNLVMAVRDVPTQIFLGIYFIWAVITTLISRMIIDIREAELCVSEEIEFDDSRSYQSSQTSSLQYEKFEKTQEEPLVTH
ncbi:hypothetical protein JB92DRAFT_3102217 [Gautieria morchelliformis]|nr:hypothetical protein JB92DRAFT_3102217 [Gautieria morchelliformis]